jgi:hypothetical protein
METPINVHASSQIPNELLHKILIGVLADSVHTICMSGHESVLNWHYNVLSTLCSVCFSFQEIARDIAVKVFGIRGEKERCGVVRSAIHNISEASCDPAYPVWYATTFTTSELLVCNIVLHLVIPRNHFCQRMALT